MKLSAYLLPTLREAPSDADNVSAKLMQRAGLVRKVASGIYEWLPLGLRVLRNVERIVREEMDRIGAQEVSLPILQPRALWNETGRWGIYGKELLRLRDRKDADFCFAPTAEEVVTDLARREVRSWRQLPLTLYQIGLKFRDEIRPRFGVMRAREFLMKDAYSFHADEEDAGRGYREIFEAYKRIFRRCGLHFKPVEAQSGAIGGSTSHEFMVLAETGEETVVSCESCDYGANLERAEVKDAFADPSNRGGEWKDPMEFATPGAATVAAVAALAGAAPSQFLKVQVYLADDKPVIALLRGDHELNEMKLAAALGAVNLRRCKDAEYVAAMGCPVGFAGPQGHNVLVYADFAVKGVVNGITGANKADTHVRNVNLQDYAPSLKGWFDLRQAAADDPCPRCGGKTVWAKGIEVGHTFKLGTKYSQGMGATFLDKAQKPQPFVMGCYGIGVSRVVAAAIEQNHDADGILWPKALAPFDVYLLPIETSAPQVAAAAEALLKALEERGVTVLIDDREERPGVKFRDCDLIGVPYRVVVGAKGLAEGRVEVRRRGSKDAVFWLRDEAAARLTEELRK